MAKKLQFYTKHQSHVVGDFHVKLSLAQRKNGHTNGVFVIMHPDGKYSFTLIQGQWGMQACKFPMNMGG